MFYRWLMLCMGLSFSLMSQAEVLNCAEEANLKSEASNQTTIILFKNNSDEDLQVYWINTQGQRQLYRNLKSGRTYQASSYMGHPWVVTKESGDCVFLLMPDTFNHTVELIDEMMVVQKTISATEVETLFDLAEKAYPTFFAPAAAQTQSFSSWLYRFYPQTNTYLGVKDLQAVYIAGDPWGGQPIAVGSAYDLLVLLQPTTNTGENGVLTFSRPVSTRTGVGNPTATLNFQVGQNVEFVWDETQHFTVNGVRFSFQTDGGSSWAYTQGNAPSVNSALVFKKGLGTGSITPGAITVSIINNDNPLSPVFITYTFE